VTIYPQKALVFHRPSVGGELATVGVLAVATLCRSALCEHRRCPVAWAEQRPGHAPGKLGLAQGAPVAMGCNEARMKSGIFHFSIGLIQVQTSKIHRSLIKIDKIIN
jgi:hypothetical protein